MSHDDNISVTTHVGRDLLQSAGLFRTDRAVIWEYVVNGIQYVDGGTNPEVFVRLDTRQRKVTISDNGRGMDWAGMSRFFEMHGVNLDRAQGRGGRGFFGTGKSAAFGIADSLRVTSICRGRRSSVLLTRAMAEAPDARSRIPLNVLERETRTGEPNGTTVEIENIHLTRLDQPGIIRYIERQLAGCARNVTVFVNNHECTYREPTIAWQEPVEADDAFRDAIGAVRLTIKVSTIPLDSEARGIAIWSNGVLHEVTLGTADGKEMSQFIFGDIDVPAIDADTSPLRPFDVSRSMRLNPENELVRAIHAFVSIHVERVRRKLVDQERVRRQSDDAQRLQRTADQIARLLNEDFREFRSRLARVRARSHGGSDAGTTDAGSAGDDDFIVGGSDPAVQDANEGAPGGGNGTRVGEGSNNDAAPLVRPGTDIDPPIGRSVGSAQGNRRRASGGFDVVFKNMGDDATRALYEAGARRININLDHPQLKAALGDGDVLDITFRRLAFEVAFLEYAFAVNTELAMRSEFTEFTDPIVQMRDMMDRLARNAATAYARTDEDE